MEPSSPLSSPSPSPSAPAATALPQHSTPALIPIANGSHCLSCSITGPDPAQRDATDFEPLVVIVPGAGDVASSYVALERLLRPFTRTLLYDRSGLGRSQERPVGAQVESSGAVTAAAELGLLLRALRITAPLILLAHSYGGIVAREFLHLYPEKVVGMVLVDASTERANEYFSVPDPNIAAVLGDLNFARVTGLRVDTVLSDDEWRVRAKDIYSSIEAARAEGESFDQVCETLRSRKQFDGQALGDRPLVVIRANTARDYRRIYEAGIQAGNGCESERQSFKKLLDRWETVDAQLQDEQLGLSSINRFVRLEDCGHNVHLIRPDVIADEVKWVRAMILSRN